MFSNDRTFERIFISDLAQPIPNSYHRALLEYYAENPVPLDVESVKAEATTRNREHHDVGGDEYWNRLGRVLGSYSVHNGTSLGAAEKYRECLRRAENRIRLQYVWNSNSEVISAQSLGDPVFVVGAPRSGTTFISNLLCAQLARSTIRRWMMYEPLPDMEALVTHHESGLIDWAADRRRERYDTERERLRSILPLLELMRPIDQTHVSPLLSLARSDCPEKWGSAEPHDSVGYAIKVAKTIQWITSRIPQPWLFKVHPQRGDIESLNAIFPRGIFIVVHRDPAAILASLSTLDAYWARVGSYQVDVMGIVHQRIRLINQWISALAASPSNRMTRIDVRFSDVIKDPQSLVYATCNALGAIRPTPSNSSLETESRSTPGRSRIKYSLAHPFGISVTSIREKYASYMESFDISPEQIESRR